MSDFVEVKKGFWLLNRGDRWHLHYNLPSVVSVQAESEGDALVKMTTRLRHMLVDSEGRALLQALYANAITWLEDYRQ